jgi:hypothetical protein
MRTLLLAAALACGPAMAEVREATHTYPNGQVNIFVEAPHCAVVLDGLLDEGAASALDAGLWQMQQMGCTEAVMVLDSAGGTPAVGYRIADFLARQRFDTAIADGGLCLSACAYAFLGGRSRYIAGRGKFGVHQHSRDGVCVPELGEAEARRLRTVLQRALTAVAMQRLLDTIRATDCGTIRVMPRPEIDAMGIANTPQPPAAAAIRRAMAAHEARTLAHFIKDASGEWTRAAGDARLAVYTRRAAGAGPGGKPAVWGLIDHAQSRTEAVSGESYRSQVTLNEVDCEAQTISVIRGLYTRGALGKGPVAWKTGRRSPVAVRPDTPAGFMYRTACGKPPSR